MNRLCVNESNECEGMHMSGIRSVLLVKIHSGAPLPVRVTASMLYRIFSGSMIHTTARDECGTIAPVVELFALSK